MFQSPFSSTCPLLRHICVFQALADEYLEGLLPLDSFLDHFLSLRSLAHKRRVRIEKLQEMLRQKSEGNPNAMATSTSINQDPSSTPSPWNQPPRTTTTSQQQPNSNSQSSSYPDTMQPAPSAGGCSGLPYSAYPAAAPNPTPVAAGSGPPNQPSQFPPYPGSGSPFSPAGSYSGPRPAFGPVASSVCPYPTQPSFPSPQPQSAFGQYTPVNPQSGSAAYPASYNYGGYSYPTRPAYSSSQSPPGRFRPGYGVPQPYSWKPHRSFTFSSSTRGGQGKQEVSCFTSLCTIFEHLSFRSLFPPPNTHPPILVSGCVKM